MLASHHSSKKIDRIIVSDYSFIIDLTEQYLMIELWK